MKMRRFTKRELEDAKKAIDSTVGKCEKALLILEDNSAQQTLLNRKIEALLISSELIEREFSRLPI